jgi:hypothetical protein
LADVVDVVVKEAVTPLLDSRRDARSCFVVLTLFSLFVVSFLLSVALPE